VARADAAAVPPRRPDARAAGGDARQASPITDEAMAMERLGLKPRLVEGAEDNIKVTTPADVALAESILKRMAEETSMMRIGSGFDVHAFGEGDHLMLGGCAFPSSAACRRIRTATLRSTRCATRCWARWRSATSARISRPRTNSGAARDSRRFLRHCALLLDQHGWTLANADLTIICERPRIGPHVEQMRQCARRGLGAAPAHGQREGHHHRKARLHRPRRRHRRAGGGAAGDALEQPAAARARRGRCSGRASACGRRTSASRRSTASSPPAPASTCC
jgi:hypothetical protein